MPNSIRSRLLLWLLLPLTIILAVSSVVDMHNTVVPAYDAYDQGLLDTALALSAHLHDTPQGPRIDITAPTERALRTDRVDRIFIAAYAEDGRLLYGDSQLRRPPRMPPGIDQPFYFDASLAGQPLRVAAVYRSVGSQTVLLEIGETTRKRSQTAQRIFWATLIPNLLNALVTLLVVVIGTKFGLRPIDDIRRQIDARSPNDLQPIVPRRTPRELVPLVTTLNHLFQLLAEATSAQKRFVSNAAHQLRTPLAGLQTQLELLVDDPRYVAERPRFERLLQVTGRLAHLIGQLLTLAKADSAGAADHTFTTVPLQPLIESCAETYLDQALARNIDLGFELEPASVLGNAWLLREMLGNLIDNALRLTPMGGTITVRCGAREGGVFLEVEDSGPGVPDAARAHLFDRFYQGPESAGRGSGLGLAIVKEIAELHHAEVQIESAAPQGARFRIWWHKRA